MNHYTMHKRGNASRRLQNEGILQMFCCNFCFQSCGELIRFYWHTHQQADPHLSFTVTEILRWKTAERGGRKGRENRCDKLDRERGSDEMKWQGKDGRNSREKKRLRNSSVKKREPDEQEKDSIKVKKRELWGLVEGVCAVWEPADL